MTELLLFILVCFAIGWLVMLHVAVLGNSEDIAKQSADYRQLQDHVNRIQREVRK